MENDLLLFSKNVLIEDKENVTIELEIEEMILKHKSVVIQIKYRGELIKEDKFKIRRENYEKNK